MGFARPTKLSAMKTQRLHRWLWCTAWAVLFVGGCSSSSDPQSVSAGGGGLVGYAGGSGSGSAGDAARAGSDPGQSSTALGQACTRDSDCKTGLICLTADNPALSGGGPPKGLCTTPCTTSAVCEALLPGAACEVGYCLEACSLGSPDITTAKCHNRAELACRPFENGAKTLCAPACVQDSQCGTNLFCDPGSGTCVASEPSGDPPGTPCDPRKDPSSCRGFCLVTSSTDASAGVCAELCAGTLPCGYSHGHAGGGCFGQFASEPTFGVRDLGYCEANCACSNDCSIPGDSCRAWSEKEQPLAEMFGARGLCYPTVELSSELTACSDGGAAGDSAGGASGASGASYEDGGTGGTP